MITAFATATVPEPVDLYRTFLEKEGDRSGTILLHHGRVKRPGKQVADFRWVELRPLLPDVDVRLADLARAAKGRYELNHVLLVHRLGRVVAGDLLLLAIVAGDTRDRCFDGCRYLVDEVKREEIIQLVEHP